MTFIIRPPTKKADVCYSLAASTRRPELMKTLSSRIFSFGSRVVCCSGRREISATVCTAWWTAGPSLRGRNGLWAEAVWQMLVSQDSAALAPSKHLQTKKKDVYTVKKKGRIPSISILYKKYKSGDTWLKNWLFKGLLNIKNKKCNFQCIISDFRGLKVIKGPYQSVSITQWLGGPSKKKKKKRKKN